MDAIGPINEVEMMMAMVSESQQTDLYGDTFKLQTLMASFGSLEKLLKQISVQ